MLACVLMRIPLGKPFGTFIPDDLIETAKKNLQESRTLLNKARTLGLWEEVASLKEEIAFLEEVISEGKTGGRPVDKATVIIFFWSRLAKRNGRVPWAMLLTLLRWFYERFKEMGYEWAKDVDISSMTEEWNKETSRKKFRERWMELKKQCTIKSENKKTVKSRMTKSERAWIQKLLSNSNPKTVDLLVACMDRDREADRKPDWKDKHIKTIVKYQRGWLLNCPERRFFPRAVRFSGDSIEVEMDYIKGGKSETLRWKWNWKTREFIKVDPDPMARVHWPVMFSS